MPTKRSVSLAALVFATLAAITLAVPLGAQQRQVLPTRLSAPPGLKALHRLAGSKQLSLALTLRQRNQEELQDFLRDLYDPTSPNYRHFLTVEQFTERFGPSVDDYKRVTDFAGSSGLAVTHVSANRLVVDVSGTVADIERAFGVTMQVYQHPTESRTFYAPDVEPSLDPAIPVQGVEGLSDFMPPRPAGLNRLPQSESGAHILTGSGPDGSYLGSDIRAAYAPGVTLNGSGQAVGLVAFGPYNLSNVQLYFTNAHQSVNVPIVNVVLDGVGPCEAGCNDFEQALDIEQAISMAPNLSALVVYEGVNPVDIVNQMATDNVAKQLSASYVWEYDPSSVEPIFQEFAAQGQNFFSSSGDAGAFTPPSCTSNCWSPITSGYPAADPYVTAVGGTDLTTTGPGGAWQSETAWVLSGGGFSPLPIQSYQVPLINSLNQGSTTFRNIPDVAAEGNADNYACGNGDCVTDSDGTSFSAPRWAGFLALVNEQANGAPVGFINPAIYAIAQGPNYASDFHDITSGNNFNGFSPDLYSAVTGYDLVTGLGSPNGQNLINALAPASTGPNFTLSSSPATLSVSPGGQASSTITVQAVNGFTGDVSLTATPLGQLSGVTAGFSAATVAESGTSTLSISTADAPLNTSIPIVVSGTNGTLTQTTYVTLSVLMPDLVETAVSGLPASLTAGSSISVADTASNTGQAAAGSSVTGFYLSATTTKTIDSHLLGTRTVPALAINAVSSGTTSVTVPTGLWPNTPYYLLACANDTGAVVEVSANNCIASSATAVLNQAAPPATATTLAMTSGGNAVTTVTAGSVVTLSATVMNGTTPVTPGRVNFCDATAAHCTDIHLLGTAQLTSAGTAALKLTPGLGSHSFKAVFVGTISAAGSSSGASALTVAGSNYPSTTAIAQSGAAGDYTLTATVSGSASASPTGQVSFLDTSNGNSVLGTAALAAGTPVLNWTNSQSPSTAGAAASSIAVGDFNGDGIPDLAITSPDLCAVMIFLGNGDGTFNAGANLTVGCEVSSVAVADFNADGKADLAAASSDPGTVSIFLGNGDGTFTAAPVQQLDDDTAYSVAAGDFNGDGKADLAVVSFTDANANTLKILLGNGDGTFTTAASPEVEYYPTTVAVGDFNGDGKPDLAVANDGSGSVSILLGNGDGTFTTLPTQTSYGDAFFLVAGDFNGDGKLDLAVANGNDPGVEILLGNGDGTYTFLAFAATGGTPSYIALGDFNGDGIPDLAVTNYPSNTVMILLGNGDGTFASPAAIPATGGLLTYITTGDFNGDGKTDVAVVDAGAASVVIQLNELTYPATATAGGISPLGTGTDMVEASYPGDSTYSPSISGTTALEATLVSFSPAGITFSSQNVGTTSAAQTETVTNHSTSALTFTSITATGSFAIAASGTTCSTTSSLAASANCTLAVTFTPTAAGAASGGISFSDNAPNSPQAVALSGTGQDFTFAVASGDPTSQTYPPGGTATYTLSVAGESGSSESVTFACAGAPSEATCTVSPSTVTAGSTATNVTVTVATTAPSFSAPRSRPLPPVLPLPPGARGLWILAMALAALAWTICRWNQPNAGRGRSTKLRLAMGFLLLLALAACGGGGGGGSNSAPASNPGTPAGNYTLTVTGTTGSGSAALSHTVTLTLTVN